VQSSRHDSYQGTPLGVPQEAEPRIRFGDCGQGLKPVGFSLSLAASLKRSPDTNQTSSNASLSRNGGQHA